MKVADTALANMGAAPRPWLDAPAEDAVYADFYTPLEPYLKRSVGISATALAARMHGDEGELKAREERRARDAGHVPFGELPPEAREFWAQQHSRRLAGED